MFEFEAPVEEQGLRAAERAFFLRSLRQLRFTQTYVGPPLFLAAAAVCYFLHTSAWIIGVFLALFSLSVLVPLFMYFARPAAAAKAARQHPTRHVVLTPDALSIGVDQSKATFPWNRFRAVWDAGDYMLLVLSPTMAIHLQKASLPAGAEAFIERAIDAAA